MTVRFIEPNRGDPRLSEIRRYPMEAIEMANDTIYGLSGMVWSLNINNALQTIRGIRAGRCWVNGTREGLVEMPIGGYKQSGQGRELGHKGFEEYSEYKNIYVNLGVSEPWGPARH